MAEKTKTKAAVVCTLCDKPITTGKPVMIDDDPYHSDCAKAMEQSAGGAEDSDEEDETEDEDTEDTDDEDEDEEEEKPAPKRATKPVAKAAAKTNKRPVVEDEDDEDEDDEDDEDEEPAPRRKAAPVKAAAKPAAKRRAPEPEEDEDDEDDEEDDEEEEEVRPAKKAAAKTATKPAAKPVAKASSKKAAAVEEDDEEYDEEDEPEERPAKKATAAKKPKAPAVDVSGWGNPATYGSKRYFVYQALWEVSKNDLVDADGPGKPEVAVARAKRLQRDWAKENKTTLSEKDKNFSSMNIGWIYNHAAELKLVMRTNAENGTYRILKATVASDDD